MNRFSMTTQAKVSVATGLLLTGCAATSPHTADAEAFRQKVLSTPELSLEAESTSTEGDLLGGGPVTVGAEGEGVDRALVQTERRHTVKHFQQIVAFDPMVNTLYAGGLVHGDSLASGTLRPFTAPRQQQQCTISGLNGLSNSVFTAAYTPSPAANVKFINTTVNQALPSAQLARLTFNSASVRSLNQAFIDVGADLRWASGHVGGSFSDHHGSARTKLLVRYVQTYFTVSCALPDNGFMGLIGSNADFRQLAASLSDADPLAYVDSVTYGREVWMYIESDYSEQEVAASMSFAQRMLGGGSSVSFAGHEKAVLDESKVQVLILGGSGGPAVKLVTQGAAGVAEYLNAGANFSPASPGVAVAYTLRYAKDNQVARISAATDYEVALRTPAPAKVVSVSAHWHTTTDDKDDDIQARAEIVDRFGIKSGYWASGRGDTWKDDSNYDSNLVVSRPLTAADILNGGRVDFDGWPHDNNWNYDPEVRFNLEDGSSIRGSCGARQNHCSVTDLRFYPKGR